MHPLGGRCSVNRNFMAVYILVISGQCSPGRLTPGWRPNTCSGRKGGLEANGCVDLKRIFGQGGVPSSLWKRIFVSKLFCVKWKVWKSYNSLNDYYRKLLERLLRCPMMRADCPNRDGTVAHRLYFLYRFGLWWCYCGTRSPIREQFTRKLILCTVSGGCSQVSGLFPELPIPMRSEVIRERYEQAINRPGVSGLNIRNSADCLLMISWLTCLSVCMWL